MRSMSLNIDAMTQPAGTLSRSAAALRSLMQVWEQEAATEESESDAELMVLLSGMVSPEVRLLGDV